MNTMETCTCNSAHETDHATKCDLWYNDDFRDGEVVWCPEFRTLRNRKESYIDFQRKQMDDYQQLIDDDNDDWWEHNRVTKTCRHWQVPFVLPNGTEVYASGSNNESSPSFTTTWTEKGVKQSRVTKNPNYIPRIIPDLGVYLSGSWVPDCIAYHIGCYDFDAPEPAIDKVLFMVEQAYNLAVRGGRVEIGCMGGHGRTGTILALLVGIADSALSPDQCMQYVWANYCTYAIESQDQEQWIASALYNHRSQA